MVRHKAWNLVDCLLAILALVMGTAATFRLSQSAHRHHRVHREYAIAWRILSQASRKAATIDEGILFFDEYGQLGQRGDPFILRVRMESGERIRRVQFHLEFRDEFGRDQQLTAERTFLVRP